MCPRDKHTRKQGFMDFSLYKKLITEISKHSDKVKRVHLHNYGEPLLDNMLAQKVKFAKEKGIKHTYIVTNGSLLGVDLSRQLIEAGLDEFKVSFYGTDQDTYNSTMKGLDFNATMKNLLDFFKTRTELKSKTPKVIIQYLPQKSNQAKTDEFRNIFSNLIDEKAGDSLNIFSLHNYAGGKEYCQLGEEIYSICDYPWRTMVILQDGRVSPCCLDYNGEFIVGNVNNNTIEEIWDGPEYSKVRENFKNLGYNDYHLCLNCEHIR
jgi:radical SAM protein with 4Fe4S-binding SPASM domain